jgi:hypothetical protein
MATEKWIVQSPSLKDLKGYISPNDIGTYWPLDPLLQASPECNLLRRHSIDSNVQ